MSLSPIGGFSAEKKLWNYNKLGSMLQGHIEMCRTPGVDAGRAHWGSGSG
jgi:transketolase N-terminal domain/subunit